MFSSIPSVRGKHPDVFWMDGYVGDINRFWLFEWQDGGSDRPQGKDTFLKLGRLYLGIGLLSQGIMVFEMKADILIITTTLK